MALAINVELEGLHDVLDQSIKQYNIDEALNIAHHSVIKNEDDLNHAHKVWKELKKTKKELEAIRKKAIEPARDHISSWNDRIKKLTDPIDQIDEIIKRKTEEYVKLCEQNKISEQISLQEAASIFDISTDVYIEPVAKTLRTEGAIVYTQVVKRFRVTDLSRVPQKYLQINADLVDIEIKLGINEIPGIEVYEEKITKMRTR